MQCMLVCSLAQHVLCSKVLHFWLLYYRNWFYVFNPLYPPKTCLWMCNFNISTINKKYRIRKRTFFSLSVLECSPLQSLSHKWKSVYPICWLLSVLAIPLSSFSIIYGQSLSISLGLPGLLDVLSFCVCVCGGGGVCCRRYLIHFANLHRWPLIMLCRRQLLYDKGCLHTINWDYARKKISWNIKWWNIIKTKRDIPFGDGCIPWEVKWRRVLDKRMKVHVHFRCEFSTQPN